MDSIKFNKVNFPFFFFKANFELNKYSWVLLGNISFFFFFLILSIPNNFRGCWDNNLDFLILVLHIGTVCSMKITPISHSPFTHHLGF